MCMRELNPPTTHPTMAWSWHPEALMISVAFSFVFFFITHYINRTRRLPVDWPLVGVLPSILANIHNLHDYMTTILEETNGTTTVKGLGSLGTKLILTCDPANVNHISNLNFRTYPKGSDSTEIMEIFGEGILNTDGESWRVQRKMAHAVFRAHQIDSFIVTSSRVKVEKALLPILNKMAEIGIVFDLQDVLLRFGFDAACELVLGVDSGCLAPDLPTVVPFAKATSDAEQVIFFRHVVPKFWWKLLRKLNIGEEKKHRNAWEVIDQFIAQSIKEAKDNKSGTSSILRSYMDQHREGHFGSDKFLRDTVFTLLAAAKDTTAVGLSWFFWLVARNPDVEAKILHELRQTGGELVYLHASLCESMRLYPPAPFHHKQSLQRDVLPSGHEVAAGMEIIISMYSMGRMKSIWGDDCLMFRPERWISEAGKLKHEPSYKFSVFSTGPRICLGKDVGISQMKIVAAAVISNYHIQVVESHVVEPKLSMVLPMKNGLMVKVTKRA